MPALWGHVVEWLLSALAPEIACLSQAPKPLKNHSFKATKEESLPSRMTEESAVCTASIPHSRAEGSGVLSRGSGHRYQSVVESLPRKEGVFQTDAKTATVRDCVGQEWNLKTSASTVPFKETEKRSSQKDIYIPHTQTSPYHSKHTTHTYTTHIPLSLPHTHTEEMEVLTQ